MPLITAQSVDQGVKHILVYGPYTPPNVSLCFIVNIPGLKTVLWCSTVWQSHGYCNENESFACDQIYILDNSHSY